MAPGGPTLGTGSAQRTGIAGREATPGRVNYGALPAICLSPVAGVRLGANHLPVTFW